jgi:hypothetical protein
MYKLTLGKEHKTIVKRVFRYLCGTKNYDVCYQGRLGGDNGKLNVHGFVDVDWGGYLDTEVDHQICLQYVRWSNKLDE